MLFTILQPTIALASDTLFETQTVHDQTGTSNFDVSWGAMTFTATSNHSITSVKLYMWRVSGDPGTITASIRATSGGSPTGSDLTSGSIAGSGLTTDSNGAAYEFTMSPSINVISGTKYAIIYRAPSAVFASRVPTQECNNGCYADGEVFRSPDSGGTWTNAASANEDSWFEIYGIAAASPAVFNGGDDDWWNWFMSFF